MCPDVVTETSVMSCSREPQTGKAFRPLKSTNSRVGVAVCSKLSLTRELFSLWEKKM